MKKQLIACAVFALLLTGCGSQVEKPAPQADVAPTAAQQEANKPISLGFIKTGSEDFVPLYQSADTSSTALARMYNNDAVEIYALEGQWYYIKYGDLFGYTTTTSVSFTEQGDAAPAAEAPAISAEAPPAPADAPAANNTPNVEVNVTLQFDSDGIALPVSYASYEEYAGAYNAYCNTTACYIYKTASTSGPKREAEMLYQGDAVTVYGTYDGFYYIGTDSGSGFELMGYVPTKYITIGTPPPAEDRSYSATAGYVDVGSCNVRSTPTKVDDTNIIDTLTKGTTFTINSFDGYWYHISYAGGSGYVSYKMVTVY